MQRWTVTAAATVTVVLLAWTARDLSLLVPGWAVPPAVTAALWFLIRTARNSRLRTRELGERAWLIERDRETAARLAVDAERARIARELHDVVSHTVSVMVIQAGAARQAVKDAPDEAADALLAVETSGRDAMTELRHLLGVLAPAPDGSDADQDLAPQPSMGRLGTLVDRIAFAGLPVEVTISGEPRPLPSGIDVTAYRVVQEALTNALKHAASGARAEVTVRYTDRQLRLEILNTGPSVLSEAHPSAVPARRSPDRSRSGRTGEGQGLLGLRERVAVYGGDLDARRRLGGGYRVRARIPLEPP